MDFLLGKIPLLWASMELKKPLETRALIDFLGPLVEEIQGEENPTLSHFSSIEEAREGSFIYALDEKNWKKAQKSSASCILAPLGKKPKGGEGEEKKVFLFSAHPGFAALRVKQNFVFSTPYRPPLQGVHPTAQVAPSAQLASGVCVGPYALVGERAHIGKNTFVGSHSVLEEGVRVGEETTIHPHVYIGHSCEVGSFCEILPQAVVGSEGYGYVRDPSGQPHRLPHTGKVLLQDHVHVGAGTSIDRGSQGDTQVGWGTKIDNQCHISHNAQIGKNCILTGRFGVAGSTTIGDRFTCGAHTLVNGHIHVGEDVHVAACSVVANSIEKPGTYGGYPIQPLKNFLKSQASLPHLPEMRKQIQRLLKKVGK